jgi:hypothetical protein
MIGTSEIRKMKDLLLETTTGEAHTVLLTLVDILAGTEATPQAKLWDCEHLIRHMCRKHTPRTEE